MGLSQNNKEVIVIKQGGKVSRYDENSRKIDTCVFEEVEHLKCVDYMPVGRFEDVETTHKLETSSTLATFYFSLHNQLHTCDFDIKHGYYVIQRVSVRCNYGNCPEDAGVVFWKVVGIKTYEVLPGCWDVKLTVQRLAGREHEQLLFECKPYVKQMQGIIAVGHD